MATVLDSADVESHVTEGKIEMVLLSCLLYSHGVSALFKC